MPPLERNDPRTYGLEIEKPVANGQTGEVQGVSQDYFQALAKLAQQRDQQAHFHTSDVNPNVVLGVTSPDLGDQGLDNGTNLQETALPYRTDPQGLEQLNQLIKLDLQTVTQALAQEGATVVNLANHPLGKTDQKTYQTYVVPKGIYAYLWHRGWDHSAGIDAKAQNSPATGVTPEEAADAFSVILGFGSAFVGLFANSPVAEGEVTGNKESRLKIWGRMMANSISEGDRLTTQFPSEKPHSLKDYFTWMYGPKTNIHFVKTASGTDYKTSGKIIVVDGNPSVLEYLTRKEYPGQVLGTNQKVMIKPELAHMEAMQFAQFAGARIRWGLDYQKADIQGFLAAMQTNQVEEYFKKTANFVYIEGRDPGANFPDRELLAAGKNIARSVTISPSALQAGLIRNLPEAVKLLNQYSWPVLAKLKEEAIKNGLSGAVDGITVASLAQKVLEVAARGLAPNEQWMLSYPRWVLKTGMNGADRALKYLGDNPDREKIRQLVISRKIVLPE